MQYVNVKVPVHVAEMRTDDDIRQLLRTFGINDEYGWDDATLGASPCGPYDSGDVCVYVDEWKLNARPFFYDFVVDGETARIFRVCNNVFSEYDCYKI